MLKHRVYCSLQAVRKKGSVTAKKRLHFPVAIVGGGPVGVLLSNLLTSYGVKHCVVERRITPTDHPQAHFITARSMEIIQTHFPTAYKDIVRDMPASHQWRDFVYCHTVLGTHFARVDHFQHDTSHEFWNSSPANIAHFPQNKFEAVLRKSMNSLTELKSIFSPSLFFGYDATDIKTSRQRNTLRIVKNSYPDPNQSAADISCDVLVGADGAHSAVRQAAGLKLQGHGALQSLLNVHFKCPGLSNFLSPRPAMLYFAFNEATVAVFVSHSPAEDEWVCQIPYFPPYQQPSDYSEQQIKELLASAMGIQYAKEASVAWTKNMRVISVKSWTMTAEVAQRYQNATGNIFLVGDAAHRFPPAGGFGMNTGLQDALNLAWKIAYSLSSKNFPTIASYSSVVSDSKDLISTTLPINDLENQNDSPLMDNRKPNMLEKTPAVAHRRLLSRTYESERRPVAITTTNLSLVNYEKSTRAAAALGVDPQLAAAAIRTVNSGPAVALLPFEARKQTVLAALQIGLQTLKSLRFVKEETTSTQSKPSSTQLSPSILPSTPATSLTSASPPSDVPLSSFSNKNMSALGRSLGGAMANVVLGGQAESRVEALRDLVRAGDSLPLIYPSQDLAYAYSGGKIHYQCSTQRLTLPNIGPNGDDAIKTTDKNSKHKDIRHVSPPTEDIRSVPMNALLIPQSSNDRQLKIESFASLSIGRRAPHSWLELDPTPVASSISSSSSPCFSSPPPHLMLSTLELPAILHKLTSIGLSLQNHNLLQKNDATASTEPPPSDNDINSACTIYNYFQNSAPAIPCLVLLVDKRAMHHWTKVVDKFNEEYSIHSSASLLQLIVIKDERSDSTNNSTTISSTSEDPHSSPENMTHDWLQKYLQQPHYKVEDSGHDKIANHTSVRNKSDFVLFNRCLHGLQPVSSLSRRPSDSSSIPLNNTNGSKQIEANDVLSESSSRSTPDKSDIDDTTSRNIEKLIAQLATAIQKKEPISSTDYETNKGILQVIDIAGRWRMHCDSLHRHLHQYTNESLNVPSSQHPELPLLPAVVLRPDGHVAGIFYHNDVNSTVQGGEINEGNGSTIDNNATNESLFPSFLSDVADSLYLVRNRPTS